MRCHPPTSNAEGIAGGVGEQCSPTKKKKEKGAAYLPLADSRARPRIARMGNSGRKE